MKLCQGHISKAELLVVLPLLVWSNSNNDSVNIRP